ncbi:peptidyl-prolyl cis-trans isomerase [Streptomyces brasiliensis]|uniref:Peptidyl-prolyl cis-trans isomerase n=1 Tax=Streptomyces brasiliensis TaxID=1954 RepID=A0A917KKX7_9ACTN|nr:peptidyl-prolyl cis-trans isomerase [Streptomyces brasiliensis]
MPRIAAARPRPERTRPEIRTWFARIHTRQPQQGDAPPRPCEDQGIAGDNGRQIVAEQLYATLKTNHGDIEVRLFPNHAPRTVANFVELAQGEREWTHPQTGVKSTDRLYDGTIFHRVIGGFMIQGGDPLGTGIGGPGYEFADEFHPELSFNKPYLLAMANAGPGTNGSQFFITVAPTAWLTRKHTIFGEVTDPAGQKVVDAIAAVPTTKPNDRPVNDVVIESIVVEKR